VTPGAGVQGPGTGTDGVMPAAELAEPSAYEQVCWRLAGFDDGLSPESVDGYLAGVLAGPRAIPAAEWLPAMLGDSFARVFADPADERFALRALTGRWKEIAAQLDAQALLDEPGTIRLEPWLLVFEPADRESFVAQGRGTAGQADDELQPGVAWARAIRAAVAHFAADWTAPDPATEDGRWYHAAFGCIDALQQSADDLRQYLDATYPGGHPTRDELIDAACVAVQDLRAYWVDHAPRPVTRRVDAQPGRNDPCPCGSGRKFKKCHGAGA
jgi:uncharacterized protein